ncbi:MAG: caspase family protein [Silvibacterium sp.]
MRLFVKLASVIIAISVLALGARAETSTRRALVIGNDSYPGNRLHNARNDARSVAAAMKHDGYQTMLVLDVNRSEMISAINRFADDVNPGDAVIIYYAGHGLQVAGENYLVPTDFKVTTPEDVKSEGYSLSTLLELLQSRHASTRVVILDACRDNPFLGTRSINGGWASIATSAGTYIAFGTSPGSTASDDPSAPHGLFTLSLLKYLSSSPLDIEQMFEQVRLDVIRESHGQQVPWTSSSLIGKFHILPQYDQADPALPEPFQELASSNTPTWPSRSLDTGTQTNSTPTGNDLPGASVGLSTPALLQQAVTQIKQGQLQNAASTLQSALANNPGSSTAVDLFGLTLHSLGEDPEAEKVLDQEISANPEDVDALIDRCLIGGNSGSGSTLNDCESAVRLSPKSAEAHVALANALFVEGQASQAYGEATRAIELSPSQSVAFALRGRIAASQGYRSIAQQDYERAVHLELRADGPRS